MTRWYLAALAVFALCGSAWGQDEKKDPPKKQATVDLDELFKKLDADGDGKISKDEFKKLTEHYKPARTGGFGGIGGKLDPETLKKLMEKFGKGGKGGFDPEQLKKLREKFGKKGEAGAFDLEQIQKILENFGGAGGFDLDMLKKLLERFGQKESIEQSRALPGRAETRIAYLRPELVWRRV
jgi:Ca2+-binding EF-hand superfamily protein